MFILISFGLKLQSDFISSEAGSCPPLTAQEECLGLAVLDLWRMASESHQSVKDLCKTVRYLYFFDLLSNGVLYLVLAIIRNLWSLSCSYKSCLPKSHRLDIQKRNRLDRFRIRNTLKHFFKKLGDCSVDERSLKLKYLIVLTGIEPSLGSETFQVIPSSSHSKLVFSLVRVTWETGIQTSESCHPDAARVRTVYNE